MILSDYDIEQLKAELLKLDRKVPVITGHKSQYFFAHKTTSDVKDGICGIECIILDIRESDVPSSKMFYVDIGIVTNIPGFYTEYLNVPVLSMVLIDEHNNKENALCHFSDIDFVEGTMNAKFRINGKPDLRIVTDNTKKDS